MKNLRNKSLKQSYSRTKGGIKIKDFKWAILVLLMVLTIPTVICQPVTANVEVNSSMGSDKIQTIMDGASIGDTITFLAGVYSKIKLSITKALNLVSDGAILNSDGTSTVFNVSGSNASGTNITGFTINGTGSNTGINALDTSGINIINNTFNNTGYAVYFYNVNESTLQSNEVYNSTDYAFYIFDFYKLTKNNVLINDNIMINTLGGIHIEGSGLTILNNFIDGNNGFLNGIDGMYVFNALIENNTIVNTDDAINIFRECQNITVINNTIINASRDGISLINRGNMETDTFTTIANNTLNNNDYGIFIGGNFSGVISGNLINNSHITGMNITGKGTFKDGSLYANITDNNVTNADNIGIAMENPNVKCLYIDGNNIESVGYSIEYGVYYRNNGTVIMGDGNTFKSTQNYLIAPTMTNDYIQSIFGSARSGDTINFLAGTYNNISLTVSHALNLVGNGAILKSSGSTVFTVNGSNASGTNLTGFTITGAKGNGISLNSVENVTISNNHLTNNSVGIGINHSQGNSITNNTIYGDGFDGVNLNGSDNNTVSRNIIYGNGRNGVTLNGSHGNRVSNNTIHDNERGVYQNNSLNNTVSGNNEYNNVVTAPTVTKTDPAKNAVVKTAKTIKVTFSETIKAGSLWVDLKKSSGTLLGVKMSINGNVLTITPNSLLGNGKYTLALHTGAVTDLTDNPLALYSTTFTVDTVAPKVSKIDPANKAVKVSAGKTIKVTFSEAIKKGSNFVVVLKNSAGKSVSFKSSISSDKKTLYIDPTSNLAESLYTLVINKGAVTDLAGNPVAAKTIKFSVGKAPTVSKVDPKNGATKVARSKVIKVTFNENIKAGSNYRIELKTSSGNKLVKITKSISGKVLTIKHTAKLAAKTKYKLVLYTGSVTDKAGNPVTGKTYTFTTGSS